MFLLFLLRKQAKINVFSIQMQVPIWSSKLLASSPKYLFCRSFFPLRPGPIEVNIKKNLADLKNNLLKCYFLFSFHTVLNFFVSFFFFFADIML